MSSVFIPPSAFPWLGLQRTDTKVATFSDDERVDALKQDVEELVSTFGIDPRAILDYGCGVGLGTVLLHRRFPKCAIYAVDGTGPQVSKGGMNDKSEIAWNDLGVTRELLVANDVPATVVDIAHRDELPDGIDTVVSMLASGWHWPLAHDMPLFERIGAQSIVVDVRGYQPRPKFRGWEIKLEVKRNYKQTRILLQRR